MRAFSTPHAATCLCRWGLHAAPLNQDSSQAGLDLIYFARLAYFADFLPRFCEKECQESLEGDPMDLLDGTAGRNFFYPDAGYPSPFSFLYFLLPILASPPCGPLGNTEEKVIAEAALRGQAPPSELRPPLRLKKTVEAGRCAASRVHSQGPVTK